MSNDIDNLLINNKRLHFYDIIRSDVCIHYDTNYVEELGYNLVGTAIAENSNEALRLWYLHAIEKHDEWDDCSNIEFGNGYVTEKVMRDNKWVNFSNLPHSELCKGYIKVVNFRAIEREVKCKFQNGNTRRSKYSSSEYLTKLFD